MPKQIRVSLVRLSVLTLAVGLVGGCSQQSARELFATGRPIIGGTPDTVHPATVAITDGPGQGYFCSGTLITNSVVLTAAHCLEDWYGNPIDPTELYVFFGNNAYNSGSGEYRGVSEGEQNPVWDSQELYGDAALLRLSSVAPAGITPIPHLPYSLRLTQADVGAMVDFSGFGLDENNDDGTKLHMSDTIDLICDSASGCDGGDVVQNSFSYDQQPGGPCSGDSGGPAYLMRGGTEYVAGITSYGDQDCTYFGVSTTVDRYADWIETFINGGSAEDCTNNADDDGDDLVDCDDPGCASFPDCLGPGACSNAPILGCNAQASGNTANGVSVFSIYSCLSDGTEDGPEVAYRLDIPAGVDVIADMSHGNSGDLDFFLLPATTDSCNPTACLDASFEYEVPEQISFTMPAGGAYLVVETWDSPTTFTVSVSCSGQVENCSNGSDDDGDSLADCADPDCANAANCQTPVENCSNGTDDDGDGLADCADADCVNNPNCLATPENCANGIDDDHDSLIDCTDPDCADDIHCQPPLENCANDSDDDGDGLADCDDPDCTDDPACNTAQEDCSNGVDDDGDSFVDCVDPDCGSNSICATAQENCANGSDDDGDGLADCDDPDCADQTACNGQDDGGGCGTRGRGCGPVGLLLLSLGALRLRRHRRQPG